MIKINCSKTFKEEYSASIVRIGEIFPIEGKDRIVKTLVNGLSIVIGKDEFKTGDVAVYISNECVLHELFLHLNSMFDDKTLNKDPEKRGYINKHGRVRCIKLGGVPSYGLLLNPESIAIFLNESVEDVVKFLEAHVGEDFDEMNGERFVHVYVPPMANNGHGQQKSKSERMAERLNRFKMLIEGSFRLHYTTEQLPKHFGEFSPEDVVDISVKIHGTSFVAGNILTNLPTNWFVRMWRKFKGKTEYKQGYNLVYSSRTVIKNQYINRKQKPGGFYGDDIWGSVAKRLNGLIPEGCTVYGEIVGYTDNGSSIQKNYDYGCTPDGEHNYKMMIYRMTMITGDGKTRECEIPEVVEFGRHLKNELGDVVMEFPLLYHGTLKDLYPDVSTTEHWHENVLELLKKEERFGMEKNEPLCKNKVPREGFVLRRVGDIEPSAWKMKCDLFKFAEAKLVDAGEADIEMTEGYGQ